MADTMGSLAAEVTRWLRGDFLDDDGQQQIRDSINNAIESIWTSMMQVQLSKVMGPGPVNFTLAANTERLQLVSITDPTVAPTVGIATAGTLPGRAYTIGYTYVTESGTETLISTLAQLTLVSGQLATVTAPVNNGKAYGWNLYVGQLAMALQNQNPLPFGITVTEALGGFQDFPDSQQQPPDTNTTADDISYINHLEVNTDNNLKVAWNQSDIDSAFMRRAARTLPVASIYQKHIWDLINGTTLEIRPYTGIQFDARYFYVKKPRRIIFDTVETPSQNVVGMHEFLVAYTMEYCKMGLEEGGATTRWSAKAKQVREDIKLALNQEGWAKNTRVAPFMRF